MSATLLLEVLTPEKRVLQARVSEVQFPSADRGIYGILPGHTPLVTPLGAGELQYVEGGERKTLPVSGGFVEIGGEGVSILARTAG